MSAVAETTPTPEVTARLADLAVATLDRHFNTCDTLDAKAWQALAAGSIVVGLAVAGQLTGWQLAFVVPSYLTVIVGSLLCVRPRRFAVPASVKELWNDYWCLTLNDLNHCIVDTMAREDGEAHNREALKHKTRWVKLALAGLALETLTVLAIAAVS